MKGLSPTQRTLAAIRREGALAGIVEKWNSHAFIRQDLFGFVDIIAIYPDSRRITAIQCTGQHGHPEHKAKILENEIDAFQTIPDLESNLPERPANSL
jgi:hypothetical protein